MRTPLDNSLLPSNYDGLSQDVQLDNIMSKYLINIQDNLQLACSITKQNILKAQDRYKSHYVR